MKTQHIVITRYALKWSFKVTGLSWESWLENTIMLADKFSRPSLKSQSDKNFIRLMLIYDKIDDHMIKKMFYNMNDNEIIIRVPEFPNGYRFSTVVEKINNYISSISKSYDSIIITRLDSDDCLHRDFIKTVKNQFRDCRERYVDLKRIYNYDVRTGEFYNNPIYSGNLISPYVSTFEIIRNGKIKCWPMAVMHTRVGRHIKGNKIESLYALQVIHDNNLSNKVKGIKCKVDKSEYGIK